MPTEAPKTQLRSKNHLNGHQAVIHPKVWSNKFSSDYSLYYGFLPGDAKNYKAMIKVSYLSKAKHSFHKAPTFCFKVLHLSVVLCKNIWMFPRMSAMHWCSPLGELLATAWSRTAVRLSRRRRPCRARLCPCERGWQMWDRDPGHCSVTRVTRSCPSDLSCELRHFTPMSQQIDTRMTNVSAGFLETFNRQESWVIWPKMYRTSLAITNWSRFISAIHLYWWIIRSPWECF